MTEPTVAAVQQIDAQQTDEGLAYRVADTGLPVGLALPGWTPRPMVGPAVLEGRYVRLEAWDRDRHADALFEALHRGSDVEQERRWTYIPAGPFTAAGALADWLDAFSSPPTSHTMTLVVTDGDGGDDGGGRVEGTATFLRTDVANGTTEVGGIVYSPALSRSRAATEAMWLMAQHAVLDLGYRRYEWKCDALNAPSRAAALRLGFTFEGLWRNAVVYKARNRDTAWFAMTDADVRALEPAYEAWLDPANFDADGAQRTSLSGLTARALGR